MLLCGDDDFAGRDLRRRATDLRQVLADPIRRGAVRFVRACFVVVDADRNRAVGCADEVVGPESVDPGDQALDVGFVADERVDQLGAGRIGANGGVHTNLLLDRRFGTWDRPTAENTLGRQSLARSWPAVTRNS